MMKNNDITQKPQIKENKMLKKQTNRIVLSSMKHNQIQVCNFVNGLQIVCKKQKLIYRTPQLLKDSYRVSKLIMKPNCISKKRIVISQKL